MAEEIIVKGAQAPFFIDIHEQRTDKLPFGIHYA